RKLLIDKFEGKKMLRHISKKYLPNDTTIAKKTGFGVPLDNWFRNKAGVEYLRNRITDDSFALKDYVNPKALYKLTELQCAPNNKYHFGDLFWALLIFDSW